MALRTIVLEGDEILRKKSRIVTEYNEKLWTLLDDMKETMYANNGAGLAAPQVGILRRVAVIDAGEGLVELINPEIVKSTGFQEDYEGCLSSPGEYGMVVRPRKVRVKAYDRNGKEFFMVGEDLLARALCHEIDHLNGVLFKDHATEIVHKELSEKNED